MDVQMMIGHLIRRLHQKSTQTFTRHMKDAGLDLTSVQYAAMNAISSNPGIDQAHVAALIAYDKATIGGVIDRLEQKGYVSRRINPRDRRAREVSLTAQGRAVFTLISPIVLALQVEILPNLSQTERETFAALAKKSALGPPA
ncbi:MAG: winged helix-turn-helix transcriptional regulator [Rhodobacteraceae bacterium]|nr:winged helix-turn-helix transcriptional regulator [Paracoccaceae bacterium]PHR55391.1 MAG: MarR family transcriptional regulator [Robiginitomaculum sp.]